MAHSTLAQGRADEWRSYAATARALSGRQTTYALETATSCLVVAQLKDMTTDLDLLLPTACDPGSNVMAASTPPDLQSVETIGYTSQAGRTYFLVVDGYAGAEGSYDFDVQCICN